MSSQIKNIGILAHVDAGKTTVTENLLYICGLTRKMGSVDNGSTVTDSMEVERKRGISVRSSAVSMRWNDILINIIDTPGHVDFSGEVERILGVIDGAIVVLSAVEGVQSHTVTLIEVLKEMKIPIIFYINKIDRAGADFEQAISDLHTDLNLKLIPLNCPINQGLSNADVQSFWTENHNYRGLLKNTKDQIIEEDEYLTDLYINDEEITFSNLLEKAEVLIKTQKIFPVYTGVAKNGIGLKPILNAVCSYIPSLVHDKKEALSVLVYKVEQHKLHGRLSHVKVIKGYLKSKQSIYFNRKSEFRTIGVVKKIELNKLIDIEGLISGDIGVITGISDIYAGDVLGEKKYIPLPKVIQRPVMTVQVVPKDMKDYHALREALWIMDSEDPSLGFVWFKSTQEFQLKIMGALQIEILEDQLLERFNIQTEIKNPSIIYKERPIKEAEGYIRYWMPKPCWAIMTFLISPGELGSGIVYESIVRTSDMQLKYQNEVARTIPRALKQGLKGWEVTDLKITLIKGEDHTMHTKPGDFILATPMGIMKGLQNTGTELLEPVMNFTIKAPETCIGRITSDLIRMRGSIKNPTFENGTVQIKGVIPAATSKDYSIHLSSLTSGKGRINLSFKGYEPCSDKDGETRDYKGVNPLDESQWILHQRGAYKAEERER